MKSIWSLLLLMFCSSLLRGATHAQESSLPTNVDFAKVEATWLQRQNAERSGQKLPPYTGNKLLNHSAQQRAETLKDKGTTTHRRLATDGYYNYRSIRSRFAGQGIAFAGEEGTMFSESLGRGYYYACKKADCTDAFIKAIKSTFAFFMREKGRAYQPHYKAIVSKQFTSVGLGIAMSGKKYYLVSHYGKNVISTGTKVELAKK